MHLLRRLTAVRVKGWVTEDLAFSWTCVVDGRGGTFCVFCCMYTYLGSGEWLVPAKLEFVTFDPVVAEKH